jgi:hypothetical protein
MPQQPKREETVNPPAPSEPKRIRITPSASCRQQTAKHAENDIGIVRLRSNGRRSSSVSKQNRRNIAESTPLCRSTE